MRYCLGHPFFLARLTQDCHKLLLKQPDQRLLPPNMTPPLHRHVTAQDAAAVRDRLKELRPAPPPLPQPAAAFDSSATTASDLVTDGVRVTCRSFYVPGESVPARGAYFFG